MIYMGLDEEAWDAFSRGRPILRAKRAGFLRNVVVAPGSWGSPEAVPALVRIGTAEAREALRRRLEVEEDDWVREEVEVVLVQV